MNKEEKGKDTTVKVDALKMKASLNHPELETVSNYLDKNNKYIASLIIITIAQLILIFIGSEDWCIIALGVLLIIVGFFVGCKAVTKTKEIKKTIFKKV